MLSLALLLVLTIRASSAVVIPDAASFVVWDVDNSSTFNTSQWPTLVRNSAYNVYGWAGNVPQVYNGVTINGEFRSWGTSRFI